MQANVYSQYDESLSAPAVGTVMMTTLDGYPTNVSWYIHNSFGLYNLFEYWNTSMMMVKVLVSTGPLSTF